MTQTVVNFLTKVGSNLVIDPRVFDFEIASNSKDQFISQMNALVTAYNNGDTAAVKTILTDLDKWSKLIYVANGANQTGGHTGYNFNTHDYITDASTGSGIVRTTMNRYMAEYVDRLIRSMRSAGWDPIVDAAGTETATTAITTMKTYPDVYQIMTFINKAIDAANQAIIVNDSSTQSQSLQQLLMVDYVSRGNELLYDEMNKLQTAIDQNQTALSYLNSLQDLMNQKDPQQFIMKLQILSTTNPASLTQGEYSAFENQSFNQTLGTVAKFSATEIATYLNTLYQFDPAITDVMTINSDQYDQMVGNMSGAFLTLSQLQNMTSTFNSSNGGVNQILTNLDHLINTLSVTTGSTQLVQSLRTIRADFAAVQNSGGIVKWVQDFNTNTEGDYQRHLNNAIVASQSLNDTKREELRRTMFVFEEFYKSATAMLSRITQLLERMASSISR